MEWWQLGYIHPLLHPGDGPIWIYGSRLGFSDSSWHDRWLGRTFLAHHRFGGNKQVSKMREEKLPAGQEFVRLKCQYLTSTQDQRFAFVVPTVFKHVYSRLVNRDTLLTWTQHQFRLTPCLAKWYFAKRCLQNTCKTTIQSTSLDASFQCDCHLWSRHRPWANYPRLRPQSPQKHHCDTLDQPSKKLAIEVWFQSPPGCAST